MGLIDWAEYRRRLELRNQRRTEVRRQLGWSDYPGWGRPHRDGINPMNKAKLNSPISMPPSGSDYHA